MAAAALKILAAVGIAFLLLSPTACIALISSNDTSNVGKYQVGDHLEFLMESHIRRILADNSQNFQTSSTNNANSAAVGDCSRQPRYDSCLGQKKRRATAGNLRHLRSRMSDDIKINYCGFPVGDR